MIALNEKLNAIEALNDLSNLTVDDWDIDGAEMAAFRVLHRLIHDSVENHKEPADIMADAAYTIANSDTVNLQRQLQDANNLIESQASEIATSKANLKGYAGKTKSLQSRVDEANHKLKKEWLPKGSRV